MSSTSATMKVIVIGASGRIGSAAVRSCLRNQHKVTAYLRTPSKLPEDLRSNANLTIVKGDASDEPALTEAIRGHDTVIQSAVYGSNSPWGTSDSTKVVAAVVQATKTVQSDSSGSGSNAKKMRLWVLSGEVLLNHPHPYAKKGAIQGDYVPIHPEHYENRDYLVRNAGEVDWSLLCPGKVLDQPRVGPLVVTINDPGLWQAPFIFGRLPFIGPYLNLIYNWFAQDLTYEGIGDFLADNLGPGGEMSQNRVGLLEDSKARK